MKYIKKAFGVNGDLTAVPDDIQSDGSVSYDTGWTDLYQRNPATDPTAKRISRAKHNQLFYDITSNTKLWQEKTFPDWIADKGDGSPFAYGKDAMVRYLDDFVYVSLEYNNTDIPSSSSKWIKLVDFVKFNINSLVDKTTPIDTDNIVLQQSDNVFKKLSFANLKATLLTYFSLGFSISLTTNGYIKFPTWLGGCIFQWVSISAGSGTGPFIINLPISFPNSGLGVIISGTDGSVNTEYWTTSTLTQTSFNAYKLNTNARTAKAFVIGY